MDVLLVARHAHAASNLDDVVNCVPPGNGLSEQGEEEARRLGAMLAGERVDLGVSSRLLRAQETLTTALDGRDVPRLVEPLLDEIGFGSFEGASLAEYRRWAWTHGPREECPGGGETRVQAALRVATALEWLLARPEEVVLAVSHALPIRYALDASRGAVPGQRLARVEHAAPHRLERPDVERAAAGLKAWAAAPEFADTPFGG